MTHRMNHLGLMIAVLLIFSVAARSQAKVTVEHNTGSSATTAFKFKTVPSPTKDDAASKAKLTLITGARDGAGADLSSLTDGILPGSEDDPEANFFFEAGTDGGRILMDLNSTIEIAQVNTYSWHTDSRAPQVYNLYASDGSDPKFNAKLAGNVDPSKSGWKLIATVDTRPKQGEKGGQYGVSITDPSGSLGKYRYLLFDCIETENDDDFGNTFYSEIDVIAKK